MSDLLRKRIETCLHNLTFSGDVCTVVEVSPGKYDVQFPPACAYLSGYRHVEGKPICRTWYDWSKFDNDSPTTIVIEWFDEETPVPDGLDGDHRRKNMNPGYQHILEVSGPSDERFQAAQSRDRRLDKTLDRAIDASESK